MGLKQKCFYRRNRFHVKEVRIKILPGLRLAVPPQFCRHLASCLAHPASLHDGESQIIPIAAGVTCLQLVAAGLEDRALGQVRKGSADWVS